MSTPRLSFAKHRLTREGCHVYTQMRWNADLKRWGQRIVLSGAPLALADRRKEQLCA